MRTLGQAVEPLEVRRVDPDHSPSDEIQAELERLAGDMSRPQSALAEQALSDDVARELAIIEAIERGRAEIRAGLFAPNDEVFDALDAEIDAARIGR